MIVQPQSISSQPINVYGLSHLAIREDIYIYIYIYIYIEDLNIESNARLKEAGDFSVCGGLLWQGELLAAQQGKFLASIIKTKRHSQIENSDNFLSIETAVDI